MLRRAFTYGQSRWFSLPKCLIVFSACLQVYTSDAGAATNQTFRAFLRVSSVKPSPSLKSSERTTKPITETTALEMFNSVSINHVNNLKPSSQVLISSRHTTWVVEPSLCTNTSTNFLGNDESVNSAKHTDEDKGVVFYKKVSLPVCSGLQHYLLNW